MSERKELSATLIAIAVRPPKTRDICELQKVRVTCEAGVQGDKRSRPGRRQVTLMSSAAWQAVCDELGQDLPWTTRRANFLVDDLPLEESSGARIQIGELLLEVTGETDPCRLMDKAREGLLEALKPNWRGGVTCRVLQEGEVEVGQTVSFSVPR